MSVQKRKWRRQVAVIASVAGLVLGLTTVSSNALTTTPLGAPVAGTYQTTSTGAAVLDDSEYVANTGTLDGTKTLATVSSASAFTAPPVTSTNTACVNAIKAAGGTAADATANCTATITNTVSAAVAAPSTTLTTAKAATTNATTAVLGRFCRSWRQWYTTASYHEMHYGQFCYDHVNAYVWGWGGFHRCGDNWGFGYTVTNTKCFGVRVNDSRFQGGYFRQQWDWTKMNLLFKGFPIAFTRKMHTNIFPSGNVVFHDN